jgi:hypothetical protein
MLHVVHCATGWSLCTEVHLHEGPACLDETGGVHA